MSKNEYLDLYRQALDHQRAHGSLMMATWGGIEQPHEYCLECIRQQPHKASDDLRHGIKRRYSWAVPSEHALDVIAAHSPRGVVEIGAGGGYWTMLLRERGVDVIAYDPDPEGGPDASWHVGRRWSEVLRGDHTAVIGHPDRTLLLCWPSYSEAWTHEVVELFDGDTIIYIGEGSGGCTGDDRMHALLGEEVYCWHPDGEACDCKGVEARFQQVGEVAIPQWWGLHDWLRVYERFTAVSDER